MTNRRDGCPDVEYTLGFAQRIEISNKGTRSALVCFELYGSLYCYRFSGFYFHLGMLFFDQRMINYSQVFHAE